jgi:KipI family sensor histidine kinase inhibitor
MPFLKTLADTRAMTFISYGPNAWLLRFADHPGDAAFAQGRALAAELESKPPPALREFTPGFTTVLLEFEPLENPAAVLDELAKRLAAVVVAPAPPAPPPREIPVVYDGPDLARVAEKNRLTVEQVISLHSETIYKVYLLGFSPGFPYLGDLNPKLHTPRLQSPRPQIAAGSVGIGGEHTGIYSVPSAGGWNIIGHAALKIFDAARASEGDEAAMFLLRPGDRVKFVPC